VTRLLRTTAILALPLALLSGCFEYSEEYWVESDKSTRLKMRAAVEAEYLEDEDLKEIQEALADVEEGLSRHPEVTDYDVSDAQVGDDHEFVIDFTLTHFEHIAGADGARRLVVNALEDEVGLRSGAPIRFEELPNGNVRFTRVIYEDDALAASTLFKDPDFSDRFLEFRLNAPEIVERDGSVLDGGKDQVEWKYALDGDEEPPPSISAELALKREGSFLSVSWWWAVPAVLFLWSAVWLRGKWATRMN